MRVFYDAAFIYCTPLIGGYNAPNMRRRHTRVGRRRVFRVWSGLISPNFNDMRETQSGLQPNPANRNTR
jgi:hypothetical protein